MLRDFLRKQHFRSVLLKLYFTIIIWCMPVPCVTSVHLISNFYHWRLLVTQYFAPSVYISARFSYSINVNNLMKRIHTKFILLSVNLKQRDMQRNCCKELCKEDSATNSAKKMLQWILQRRWNVQMLLKSTIQRRFWIHPFVLLI